MKTMHRPNKELAELLYALLELERRAIGVKLLTKTEYQDIKAKELEKPINYCQMAAAASKGNAIKATSAQIKCSSGSRGLGFDHKDEKNANGENWTKLGLYKDGKISREIRNRIDFIPEGTYGILLQPFEKYTDIPDVVIIVTNPYNIMRLIQGYGYAHGEAKQLSLVGNQALCLECTTIPYMKDDINISALCIGTRHQAGWKETEMAVGVAGSKLAGTIDGLFSTLNIMEDDVRKAVIEEKLKKAGIPYDEVRYKYNYYMDC